MFLWLGVDMESAVPFCHVASCGLQVAVQDSLDSRSSLPFPSSHPLVCVLATCLRARERPQAWGSPLLRGIVRLAVMTHRDEETQLYLCLFNPVPVGPDPSSLAFELLLTGLGYLLVAVLLGLLRGGEGIHPEHTHTGRRVEPGYRSASSQGEENHRFPCRGPWSRSFRIMVWQDPTPRKVRVKTSGGIPICPICGMPMESINALRREKAIDILLPTESGDRRWRCYHEYPVVFVPDAR